MLARGARGQGRRAPACCAAAPSSRAPRPYSFQGLGEEGLEILAARARGDRAAGGDRGDRRRERRPGRASTPTRSRSARATCRTSRCCSASAGRRKPVLLKRGMAATIEELLMSAEYILSEGNHDVILCERGIRTFADPRATRSTWPRCRRSSSSRTCRSSSTRRTAPGGATRSSRWRAAAVAVGADGLIVEVHHDPDRALSDGPQSITPDAFGALVGELRADHPRAGEDATPRPGGRGGRAPPGRRSAVAPPGSRSIARC